MVLGGVTTSRPPSVRLSIARLLVPSCFISDRLAYVSLSGLDGRPSNPCRLEEYVSPSLLIRSMSFIAACKHSNIVQHVEIQLCELINDEWTRHGGLAQTVDLDHCAFALS